MNGHNLHTIRAMANEDIGNIMDIEATCFSDPWSVNMFAQELAHPLTRYFVLETSGVLAAYAGMYVILDEAHVTNVATRIGYQRLGFGRTLMTALMKEAASLGATAMTLEVRASNHVAQHLYARLDFQSEGVRPGYYSDGEDALILWQHDLPHFLAQIPV